MILRWEQGRSSVDALLARGQLTRVSPNSELAESLLGPTPEYPVAQSGDVAEAVPAAAEMIDVAIKVIGQMPAY